MRLLMMMLVFTAPLAASASTEIRQYFEALTTGYSQPVQGELLLNPVALERIYKERDYQPIWYRNGKLIPATNELYLTIETIIADGLQPEDYHNRALQQKCPAERTAQAYDCDLLFTDAFLLLAQHLMEGKVDPDTLSAEWKRHARQQDLVPLLNQAVQQSAVKSTFMGLRPKSSGYERMMGILRRLRAAIRYADWGPLPVTPAIEVGQQDERLPAIVERLVFWGDVQKPEDPLEQYVPLLQPAVERFQERHGLVASGVIDAATVEALNVTPTRRAQQIMANMERQRWLARDLGPEHLFVNLAGLELEIVKHEQVEFSMPIAIDRQDRHMPLFSDKLQRIVLNPSWVVPHDLAVQEILPAVQRDPGYLAAQGFAVYSGDTLVDPDTIDWSELSIANFPYRLVQPPGPKNPLGQIKLVFPNAHNIYLHGAPDQAFTEAGSHPLSAGSIRVDRPLELTAQLLQDPEWSREKLAETLTAGVTETLYLKRALPVHIGYKTAWVSSPGVLHFRKDIHQRDIPLYERLIQPLQPQGD